MVTILGIPWFIAVEQILNGLILGSMYALIGIGLTLIWGTMRMLNFAQGEFYMLGGYVAYFVATVGGLNPWISLPIAAVSVFAAALVVERIAVRGALGRENWTFTTIVATLGVSIVLQNAVLLAFGERFQSVPYLVSGVLALGPVRMAWHRVAVFGIAAALSVAMFLLLTRTRFGLALRAASQDRDAATLYGVNASAVFALTFGLAAALAAVAATALAPIFSVSPWMGGPVMLKGFVVVVLGGLGSFPGAIVGGLILGIVESLGVLFGSSEWREVISYALLIAVVAVKPWGLFGVREA